LCADSNTSSLICLIGAGGKKLASGAEYRVKIPGVVSASLDRSFSYNPSAEFGLADAI
jgi:hypothetical protein